MAYDAKGIINLGLGKIAASLVSSISPPRSPVERHVDQGYAQWRKSELEKRRWVFATEWAQLTEVGPRLTGNVPQGLGIRFALPVDSLRVIRQNTDTWAQRGRYIYARDTSLMVEYIRDVPEGEFPPSFVEVLSCRIAQECVEFTTQSNTKLDTANALYKIALNEAGRANAFILGSEDITGPDENYDWVNARWGQ